HKSSTDAGGVDSGAAQDAGSQSDASPGTDAHAGPDSGSSDGGQSPDGSTTALSCSTSTTVEKLSEDLLLPVFGSNGAHIALAFTRGFNPPQTVAVELGDGVTFGAAVDVLTDVNQPLFVSPLFVAPDGRLVVRYGSSSGVKRNILAADGMSKGNEELFP